MRQQTAKTILRVVREATNKRYKKLDKKVRSPVLTQNNIDDDHDFVKLGNDAAELYLQIISDATIHWEDIPKSFLAQSGRLVGREVSK
jgi:hypothetical protein